MGHDVIVLGGGPTGASAATLLAGRGLDVAVVDPLGFGGRLLTIDVLRDSPEPLEGTAGWDLAATLGERAMDAGVTSLFGHAERVEGSGTRWRVCVDGDDHEAFAVLVATGCRDRPLPGDERGALAGRGVSYCAACDAGLFAGRSVVVYGDGEWAWTEVLTLAPLAADVVWVDPAPAARPAWPSASQLKAIENVRILTHCDLVEVLVEGSTVQGVEVVHGRSGRHEIVQAAGVFGAEAGLPNSGPVVAIAFCDEDGFVHTDPAFACPGRPGLYAAGDVRSGARRSVETAMAEGVAAATAIAEHLHGAPR